MKIKKGDKIYAIDEKKTLEVEGLWKNASKTIDFSAKYTTTNFTDSYGNKLFGTRGFRFQDNGVIWRIES
ncbi:hypothetical protein ABFV99_13290 [Cytobacillus horneckiae]|uniref:hypothetical protein n=1 Tax=Cytobacillus horneckiae TaxID=549687 RepID=UPI0034CE30C1